jgi:hypothetical protein
MLAYTQAFGAYWTAMWSLLFYLSLEKVWNYRLLSTPWYFAQPLLLRLVTMQVGVVWGTTKEFIEQTCARLRGSVCVEGGEFNV